MWYGDSLQDGERAKPCKIGQITRLRTKQSYLLFEKTNFNEENYRCLTRSVLISGIKMAMSYICDQC